MSDMRRRLLWNGVFLFLLGLLSGFVEQQFKNPRMGLAAHLEGLMNGLFLLVLAAIWSDFRLPPRATAVTYWAAIYGTYVNWGVTVFAATVGAAALSPITSAGYLARGWEEGLVTAGFASVGLAMVGVSVLALWGLRRTGGV
jgi:hydroxylaminobenzene mutase